MIRIAPRLKRVSILIGFALLALIGWCLLMVAYFSIYGAFEDNAVPVSLPNSSFGDENWDNGFFMAQGSFTDDGAIEPGDELPLQTMQIVCKKSDNTCTTATASVFNGFLDVDTTTFNVSSWTDRLITFEDVLAVCSTGSYAIDRVAKTFTLTIRKRPKIPDWATKSLLKPCEGRVDKTLTMADGFRVYWHKRQAFEQRNGIYFHLLLLLMNAAFFFGVYRLWSRHRPKFVEEVQCAQ